MRDNRPDRALLYAEHSGKFDVRFARFGSSRPDLLRDLVGEFGAIPAMHILSMRNWLKMFWVHARWNSTEMVKIHPVWDDTKSAKIRLAVGQSASPDAIAISEDPVTVPIFCECPNPARGCEPTIFDVPKTRIPIGGGGVSMGMTVDVPQGVPPHIPPVGTRFAGDRRETTAPALAETGGVGGFNPDLGGKNDSSLTVASTEASWSSVVDGHGFATTTLAEFWTRLRTHVGLLCRLTLGARLDGRVPAFYGRIG